MRKKDWTIIVGLGEGFRPFQITLSRRRVYAALSALLIGALLFLGIAIKFLSSGGDRGRYTLLKEKKTALLFELGRLSQRIDSLKEVAHAWVDLDKGMRTTADLAVVDPAVRALGVGGRIPDRDRPPRLLDPALREQLLDLKSSIGELQREVAFEEESLAEILASLKTQENLLAHTPSIVPTAGRITSGFGWRYNRILKRREFHKGLDIANVPGTPVFAPADGVVVYRGPKGGFGRFLTIDHGYGYRTRYGHLRRILVRTGERVRRGQIIAHMGSTGLSTGPHLHYEVLVLGTQVDPRNYIAWEFTKY